MEKQNKEAKNTFVSYCKIIWRNCKLETMLMFCFIGLLSVSWLPEFEFLDEVVDYFNKVIGSMVDISGILIGIYIAIVSILATSTTSTSIKIVEKKIENDFITVVSAGLLADLLLIIFCVFVPVFNHMYYWLFSLLVVITFVSLIKFLWIILLIFKYNMQSIANEIDNKNYFENHLLTNLEDINENTKKDK